MSWSYNIHIFLQTFLNFLLNLKSPDTHWWGIKSYSSLFLNLILRRDWKNHYIQCFKDPTNWKHIQIIKHRMKQWNPMTIELRPGRTIDWKGSHTGAHYGPLFSFSDLQIQGSTSTSCSRSFPDSVKAVVSDASGETHTHTVYATFQHLSLPLILRDTNMKGLLEWTPFFIVARPWFTHLNAP